jgi:hypothetical protein
MVLIDPEPTTTNVRNRAVLFELGSVRDARPVDENRRIGLRNRMLGRAAKRAFQTAIGSSRLARVSSPAGFRPRLYCRGEQPMTLLNAVLKALSDS